MVLSIAGVDSPSTYTRRIVSPAVRLSTAGCQVNRGLAAAVTSVTAQSARRSQARTDSRYPTPPVLAPGRSNCPPKNMFVTAPGAPVSLNITVSFSAYCKAERQQAPFMSQWGSSGSVQAVRWQSKLTHDPGRFAGGLAVPNRADGHCRECQARLEQCQRQRQHHAIGSVGCGEGSSQTRRRAPCSYHGSIIWSPRCCNYVVLQYRMPVPY
jgi:hypothetical protein